MKKTFRKLNKKSRKSRTYKKRKANKKNIKKGGRLAPCEWLEFNETNVSSKATVSFSDRFASLINPTARKRFITVREKNNPSSDYDTGQIHKIENEGVIIRAVDDQYTCTEVNALNDKTLEYDANKEFVIGIVANDGQQCFSLYGCNKDL